MRALDEPGDVGHHEALLAAPADHAQVGHQRGERVVGDLGPGPRDAADEGRLAGVGEADDAHVGQELQLEHELPLLAGRAVLGVARRLVGGGGEVHVARGRRGRPWPRRSRSPGPARSTSSSPVAVVVHHACPAGPAARGRRRPRRSCREPPPFSPLAGPVLAHVPVVEQRGELRVDHQDDVAAVAAVAAGRTAARDELLAPPGDGAVAAVAGLHVGCGPRRRTSWVSLLRSRPRKTAADPKDRETRAARAAAAPSLACGTASGA